MPKMSAFLKLADIAPSPMTRPTELKSNPAFISAARSRKLALNRIGLENEHANEHDISNLVDRPILHKERHTHE